MATCQACRGSGRCSSCGGKGSWKKTDTHPSSGLVNPNTGEVKCGACNGKTYCQQCNGTGRTQ